MSKQDRIDALDVLKAQRPVDKVIWPDAADAPTFMYGRLSAQADMKPDELVEEFLGKHGAIYGIDSSDQFRVSSVKHDSRGNSHIAVERVHAGVRVYPSRLSLWVDPSGTLQRVKANWPELPKIRTRQPKVSADQAVRSVARLRKDGKLVGAVSDPRLEYQVVETRQRLNVALAWNFVARFSKGTPTTEGFIVNAENGRLITRYIDEDEIGTTTTGISINSADETAATPLRTIDVDDPGGGADLTMLDTSRSVVIETRDMAGATDTAGTYVLCADDDSDGQFTNITNSPRNASDRPEVGAQYNTGRMHDYLERSVTVNGISLFGRTGWADDATRDWISQVHRGTNLQGSSFSRTVQRTSHGDGDGTALTYKPSLDTCSHEWTHAVQFIEVTGGISSSGGGLDGTPGENFVVKEASADLVSGAIARDWGWHYGFVFEEDAALPGATHASTNARLRGFQSPSTYTQPDHYYAGGDTLGGGFAGATDYARVGILDKAGYMMAAGGTHPSAGSDPATYPPIPVYGIGVRCFENILYYVQTRLMGPADVFSDFRQDMIDAATALYPTEPCKAQTVARAFDAVGVYETGTTPPAPPSGPDPMITPWGARTDNPPYWQSPDIYVKDAADNIAPPLKGQVNRLFARVTNIGTATATDVDVEFSFKPYGAGTGSNAEKVIGTETVTVAVGASEEVEIAWDLTDLTDTNGGLWPLPLDDFDHFCVIVRLTHATDVDTCNNIAQNNFGEVGTANGDGDGVQKFLIGNSAKVARWIALIPHHRISDTWSARLDLSGVIEGNGNAARVLSRMKDVEIPWVGEAQDAVLIPMLGGETRAAEFAWQAKSRDSYDGPIHGCLYGAATGSTAVTGKLFARIEHLKLDSKSFHARIVGRIKTKSGNTAVRGELSGEVAPKTGKFSAAFTGMAAQGKQDARRTKFKATGVMAASGMFSFVVVNGGDQQGIDLSVRVIGDLNKVCRKLRVPIPRRKPEKSGRKKSVRRKPTGRKTKRSRKKS